MVNRQELRKKLPHGYCKEVAKQAGVSIQTVSRYFSYNLNSERVENTVLAILSELSDQKRKMLDNIL